jgi:hypothetical protein
MPTPAIVRIVSGLAKNNLVDQKRNQRDRRSNLIGRTVTGMRFLRELKAIVDKAAACAHSAAVGRNQVGVRRSSPDWLDWVPTKDPGTAIEGGTSWSNF